MFYMRAMRLSRGLTLKEVGDKIGVTESAAGLYETGRRKPNYEMLLKISEALNCTVNDLLYSPEELKYFATNSSGEMSEYEKAVLGADEREQSVILRLLRMPKEKQDAFLIMTQDAQNNQLALDDQEPSE